MTVEFHVILTWQRVTSGWKSTGLKQRVYGDSETLIATTQALDFTSERVAKGAEIDEVQRSKNRKQTQGAGPSGARLRGGQAAVGLLTKVPHRGATKNATLSFVALSLATSYLARRSLA